MVLPVSKTPMDMPTLDIRAVSRRAFLQNGIAHIPKAVTNIENPRKKLFRDVIHTH